MRMMRRAGLAFGVVALASAPACDADDDFGAEADGDAALRTVQSNGIQLNGIQLNGIQLNGIQLNGPTPSDYVVIKQFRLDGEKLGTNAWLEGSELRVREANNTLHAGVGLENARIKFEVSENGTVKTKTIKIVDITPPAPGSSVWLYDLQLKVDSGVWKPLCYDSQGAPTKAILLGAVWDPSSGERREAVAHALTFACHDAALAKCVEWGYMPWSSASGVTLKEYHQACTRMVRADYCGDGVSHTVVGTPVHVLDPLGVQKADASVSYVVEAEWGPDGATCLNADNTRLDDPSLACQLPACGGSFAGGALIQSGKVTSGP